MRLFLLTALTMTAFAANSVLNRLAVIEGHISAEGFAVLRVASGAVVLALLVWGRQGDMPLWSRRRIAGAGGLAVYMLGFSFAYLALDAGLGALVLFFVVQFAMFGFATLQGDQASLLQWGGAVTALVGLALVLWPGGVIVAPLGAIGLMACAGLGWAIYTLAGRSEPDPLGATAANFLWCLPVVAGVAVLAGSDQDWQTRGVVLAILSGGATSGLGYALWYGLIPQLGTLRAATVQLSAPVIAIAIGVVLLSELVTPRLVIGTLLVLGGIALVLRRA